MTHINIERLLLESPIPVDPQSIDEVHQRVFGGRPKREKPDHYELHEELGRGQFGRVHRATDTRYPREVALKLIPYRGTRQLARLEREAHALAKLSHPNIVSVFDKGVADVGSYYLATELVPGDRLDHWMADPSRKLHEILEVFAQAAEGLHHAHQRGLIHRDFKPSNAIVDQGGRLRILDFGLAKLVKDDAAESHVGASATQPSGRPPLTTDGPLPTGSPTASAGWSDDAGPSGGPKEDLSFLTDGQVIGTPRYASPEQLSGRKVDPRSDQFSLCVALFEACHGFSPFGGRTSIEIAERIEAKAVQRGRPRWKLPPWLKTLIERGLSSRPEDRFESTEAIAKILREHLRPPRRVWMGVAAGVVATVVAGGGAWSVTRARLDIAEAGLTEEVYREIAGRHGDALSEQIAGYATRWQGALEAANRVFPAPGDDTVACLGAGLHELGRYVDALTEPPPDANVKNPLISPALTGERIWLAALFDPSSCLGLEPQWERDGGLVAELRDAQVKRLHGDYDGAVTLLEPRRKHPSFADGLPRGLLFYELGTARLHQGNPLAWDDLGNAAMYSTSDSEFRASALYRRLEAGVLLDAAEQQAIDYLLDELRHAEADGLMTALAEGYASFLRRDFAPAKASYARARQLLGELPEGPYRDYLIAHCTLHEAYAEANTGPLPLDAAGAEALERAIDATRAALGDGHPIVLQHGVNVARLLREAGTASEASKEHLYERAASQIARLNASVDPNGPSRFDVLRLRSEALILDLERHGDDRSDAPLNEWIAKADAIRDQLVLQARLQPLGRQRNVFEIWEILFITYVTARNHGAAVHALEEMVPIAAAIGRHPDVCDTEQGYVGGFLSLLAEEKNEPSGGIPEIEARLRTLCK